MRLRPFIACLEVSGNPEDDDKRDNVGFGNGFGAKCRESAGVQM